MGGTLRFGFLDSFGLARHGYFLVGLLGMVESYYRFYFVPAKNYLIVWVERRVRQADQVAALRLEHVLWLPAGRPWIVVRRPSWPSIDSCVFRLLD